MQNRREVRDLFSMGYQPHADCEKNAMRVVHFARKSRPAAAAIWSL